MRTWHTGLPEAQGPVPAPSPRAPPARQEGPCGLLPEGNVQPGAGLSLQDQRPGRSALVGLPQPLPQAGPRVPASQDRGLRWGPQHDTQW